MAILIDYNQVALASLFVTLPDLHMEIDMNVMRHIFLNSIRANRQKFKNEFGEVVICADGQQSWRRNIFPYYKANRRKSREESTVDWEVLFGVINGLREELDEYFPYKVIRLDECEADDIIGTIIHNNGVQLGDGPEKFLILSSDKDYIQLHKYSNVRQYSPIQKKWVLNSDPEKYLTEQVIKGDSGDGVPNILSADNCLVIGERQTMMTQKRLALYSGGESNMTDEIKARFERNKAMIDLSNVPANYQANILQEYAKEKPLGRQKLRKYFVDNQLTNLFKDLPDF